MDRTLDVFKLQELSEDPDPHATLPFISHHTLNISRELDEGGGGEGDDDIDIHKTRCCRILLYEYRNTLVCLR